VRPAGGVAGGRRIDWPASGIDVAPTLLALADIEPAAVPLPSDELPLRFFGSNLLGVAENPPAPRALLVEDRDHLDPEDIRLAFYQEHWKLVRLGLGEDLEWKLYDLRADPGEKRDVGGRHPEVLERLQDGLNDLRAAWGVSDREDSRAGVNTNTDALKALGYMDS
jgi:arylsulfatase A-like enzyme